ncbi:hypothetical protein [Flavobacterium sp. KACC 22761]|uniref:hypothetical protein n=1 Tax=Flavobacterium sp. KACC 22761 TaxID=3092665 RepID=UPI002A7508A4|nr:hypothetical protein [Flavobacterium sp. KACC 22761]WPO79522.1 hypothetical protein SCB73_03875 [Flavobacterium sp. KACC 22761]
MNLNKKKILFIAPNFHDYENMIKFEFLKNGASVDFFPERSYGFDFNIINNFFTSYLAKYQSKHYNKILQAIKNEKYDYLFVIRGYMMPVSFLEVFKKNNPNCKTIMYQWDSERTNPFQHLIPLFDTVKTFDFKDSEDLNIKYIPLFYTKDVEDYRTKKKNYKFDFFFMGFFFEERYDAILKFKEFCIENGYVLKPFLFMPFSTRVKYFFKGKTLDRSIVSFKHMNRSEYLQIVADTRIMVDVSNSRQTGLAMRVIESLACNTKVATNNVFFKKDALVASSGLVSLFDLNDIKIDNDFFNFDAVNEKKVVLSLEEWLVEVFIN